MSAETTETVRRSPFARLTTAGIAGVFALTACGVSEGEGAPTPEAASSSAAATFNEADVTFATDMIPHHRQAVEMATLAGERAGSDEVKALAAEIASIPEHIRGYGHVKEAHLHKAKAREAELLAEWANPLRVVQVA